MNKQHLRRWLEQLLTQSGGNITAVQTVRNAIMAASVLASAALVAIMGVLATAAAHSIFTVVASMLCLLVSSFFSIRTIWLFASLSFTMQLLDETLEKSVEDLLTALGHIRIAAVFLFLALAVAALGLFFHPTFF